MSPALSTHLDLVRLMAALTVLVGHFSGSRISGGLLWQLRPYGDEAVVVFFVLSGFVIAHVTERRQDSRREYFIHRAARLYSVAVPALVLTALLDHFGTALAPAAYRAGELGYQGALNLGSWLVALTFTHEFWDVNLRPGSNAPYWSLGYEAVYYLAFGLAHRDTGRWRWWLAAGVLLAAGPSIAMLAPLWLLGVLAYRLGGTLGLGRSVAASVAIGALTVWATYELVAWTWGRPVNMTAPLIRRGTLLQDYVIGCAFAAYLLGLKACPELVPRMGPRLATGIRWLAGATFSLYLMHYPLLTFLAAVSPWPAGGWARVVFVLGPTLLAIYGIAAVTERRKEAWRRAIDALLKGRSKVVG